MKKFQEWLSRNLKFAAVIITFVNIFTIIDYYYISGNWWVSAFTMVATMFMWFTLGKSAAYHEMNIKTEKHIKEVDKIFEKAGKQIKAAKQKHDDLIHSILFRDQENEIMGQVEDLLGPQDNNDQDKDTP